MRDGKALQMGTSHELGQKLRQGLRHQVSVLGEPSGAGLDHLLGHVRTHGRRADHGSRRRQRPARPPGNWRRSRSSSSRSSPNRSRSRRSSAANSRSSACASGLTIAATSRSAAGPSTGKLRGVPLRIEVGPRDLAEGRVTIADRLAGGKEPVGLDAVVATVPRPPGAGPDRHAGRGRGQPRRTDHRGDVRGGRGRGRERWLGEDLVDHVGTRGESLNWPSPRSRCGACSARTATVPERDDEPDLVAFRRPRLLSPPLPRQQPAHRSGSSANAQQVRGVTDVASL